MKRYIVIVPFAGQVEAYADSGVKAREYAAYALGMRDLPIGTVVIEVRPVSSQQTQPKAA